MIAEAEINQMSLDERLITMELLWKSIIRSPEKVPFPAWHGQILSQRLAKIEAGEATFLSLDEVKNRLRSPRASRAFTSP